ncbi:MAG: hypothetical protein H0W21_08095 [Actinobacteria bacterium]|nr:hypothetical protein [Actinomycetota bacterium]
MDETTVREHALLHAQAVQRGELRAAARDLTEHARASAPAVMAALPPSVTSVEIPRLDPSDGGWLIHIAYGGATGSVLVESVWAEVDGRPMLTQLRVL